ncbi:MAG TPA: hypothetical protein VGH74_02665 [Planctomycetaceae bacterium]
MLAVSNVWFTAARSTIPLSIDDRIISKHKRLEKLPGIDDVYLLKLARGKTIQVDEPVYRFVVENSIVRKDVWATQLHSGNQNLELDWSRDFRMMRLVMPAVVAAFIGLWTAILRRRGNAL